MPTHIDTGAPAIYPAVATHTGRTDLPKFPKAVGRLKRLAKRAADRERSRDIFMRLRAVTPDPDGEHIWLLLDPKKGEAPDTIH